MDVIDATRGARICVVEGNPPVLAAAGQAMAPPFARTLAALAPDAGLVTAAPYAGESLPREVDAYAFTGASCVWSVADPQEAPLRRAMEAALASGRPVWGSCGGMQLGALVLGARIREAPAGMELGVARDLRLTAAGRGHPLLAGRTDGWAVPCMHRDEVHAPGPEVVVLAGNAHSAVQVVAGATAAFFGTQYHPELSPREVAAAMRLPNHFRPAPGTLAALEAPPGEAADRLDLDEDDLAATERRRELAAWAAWVAGAPVPA